MRETVYVWGGEKNLNHGKGFKFNISFTALRLTINFGGNSEAVNGDIIFPAAAQTNISAAHLDVITGEDSISIFLA